MWKILARELLNTFNVFRLKNKNYTTVVHGVQHIINEIETKWIQLKSPNVAKALVPYESP